MSIIIFLIILAVLILVHEFGHFIVAKKSGIRVDEFGLGFPPKIFGKKFGGTLYSINAIPFGGFVKIFGEDPVVEVDVAKSTLPEDAHQLHYGTSPPDDKSESFYYKPKWIQALVLVAGVSMNIIFAWLLISLGFFIGLPSPVGHSGFGTVQNSHLVITEVLPSSPAEKAGLKSGDIINIVSSKGDFALGQDLSPQNVQSIINDGDGKVEINYTRGNNYLGHVSLQTDNTIVSGKKAIGIAMDNIGTLKLPIHLALIQGALTTYLLTKSTVVGLGGFLWQIITFKSDFSQVSGPIGIVGVVSDAQTLGFVYLLSIIALISINLAVINILPFPALDGGRLLFIIIEFIIQKPISPSFVKRANLIGFSFLIILMLVVTGHDILKLL